MDSAYLFKAQYMNLLNWWKYSVHKVQVAVCNERKQQRAEEGKILKLNKQKKVPLYFLPRYVYLPLRSNSWWMAMPFLTNYTQIIAPKFCLQAPLSQPCDLVVSTAASVKRLSVWGQPLPQGVHSCPAHNPVKGTQNQIGLLECSSLV